MREESCDVEADTTGADDGDTLARLARSRQQVRIGNGLGVTDSFDLRHKRAHAARQDDLVELAITERGGIRGPVELQAHAGEFDASREVSQRIAEVFLSRHLARITKLSADLVCA